MSSTVAALRHGRPGEPRHRRAASRATSSTTPSAGTSAATSTGCAAVTSAPCRPSPASSSCAILFTALRPDTFPTPLNITNLLVQAVPISLLAMGLVFVLLLGEIDLSAGVVSGVCAAVMAVLMARHDVRLVLGRPRGHRSSARDRPVHRRPGQRRADPVVRGDPGAVPRLAGRDPADHRSGRHGPGPRSGDRRVHQHQHVRAVGLDPRGRGDPAVRPRCS